MGIYTCGLFVGAVVEATFLLAEAIPCCGGIRFRSSLLCTAVMTVLSPSAVRVSVVDDLPR